MKNSVQLHDIGQSFWLDNIDRRVLISGEMQTMVEDGVIWGVTSNPSIFQKAITSSNIYRSHIQAMSWIGLDAKQIYENLVIRDIRDTADILMAVFEKTNGKDGYVSIEVDPDLAEQGQKTVDEAERLWKLVDRPNVMIKIPATDAGIFAIRETIKKGINVNITLIFSVERYKQVIDAYYAGLELRLSDGKDISSIHSVASFFISRMDSKVDKILDDFIAKSGEHAEDAAKLKGKIGIDNALVAYDEFQKSVGSDRFKNLQRKGANVQRPLWASTSTKNLDYSDILYVQGLVLPQTVNTIPDATLAAFLDHGKAEAVDFDQLIKIAKQDLELLESIGVEIDKVTEELKQEGVEAFSGSQSSLMADIENLRDEFVGEIKGLSDPLKSRITKFEQDDYIKRLCAHDVTLWPADEAGKAEIAIRLDWLEAPITSKEIINLAESLRKDLEKEGYTHAVVLGMGGSSLAPEVYGKLAEDFGSSKGLDLSILDSTSPEQVLAKRDAIPLEKTVFFVSSKSGSTSEMEAGFKYFWNEIEMEGDQDPGNHFIAITDPGSSLEDLAKKNGFRQVFQADPNVGGRYSALIEFGIVPAVSTGIDPEDLLRSAQNMMVDCGRSSDPITNPGIILGALMGAAHESGRDKLTILADPILEPIGAWVEQLVAESSGKDGKGILPVANEPMVDPGEYGDDRLFVYLASDGKLKECAHSLINLGHPVITLLIDDVTQLGSEFFRWELATAAACSIIGVNAFDQPNVQLSKSITKEMIAEYKEKQRISEGVPIFTDGSVDIYGEHLGLKDLRNASSIFNEFLGLTTGSGYIAINAFVARNKKNEEKLQAFRKQILESTGLATTLGFGPRFLHSTGQLHKGGKNNGLFIVITADPEVDAAIPGDDMTFATLLKAQSIGDTRALQRQNRRVLRLHFKEKVFQKVDLMTLL